LATSGDFFMATCEDFLMAMDRSPLDDGQLNRWSGSCFRQVASGLLTPAED
jgi:hypothetical protein